MHPEFELREGLIYLNHAGIAPWPRRTRMAVQRFAEENTVQGAQEYACWLRVEADLREQLRQLLNAPSADDVALLKSTSEGLSLVAYGLEWQPGDNIVSFAEEFPSNRIVWESLADRDVDLRLADTTGGTDPVDSLKTLVDENTRLIAVSSVQYASGIRIDLDQLGSFCRSEGILLCVDAIQSVGALRFDVQACHADFVVADGHKWMLGPEGLAVFYCRSELRERLRLHEYGWHMVEHAGDFDRRDWQPASTARRFECGSPNMLGTYGLHASLSLILETGLEHVERVVLSKARHLMDLIEARDELHLITPSAPGSYAGIVTFAHRQADPQDLHRALSSSHVVCAMRGGGLRFSPHFYTPEEDLVQAVELVCR